MSTRPFFHIGKLMRQLWRLFLALWRKIPVVGGLADCTVQDHKKASKEFFFSLFFSTVTFWLTAFVMRVMTRDSNYFDHLFSTTRNGELLIFSVSFLGPIYLISLSERQGKREFPARDWHVFALMGFGLAAAILFAQLKTVRVIPGQGESIDMPYVLTASYLLAGGAVLLRYLTMVYQKSMHAADEMMAKSDKDFANNFAAHKKNEEK